MSKIPTISWNDSGMKTCPRPYSYPYLVLEILGHVELYSDRDKRIASNLQYPPFSGMGRSE